MGQGIRVNGSKVRMFEKAMEFKFGQMDRSMRVGGEITLLMVKED